MFFLVSLIFGLGFVSYSNHSKIKNLKVPKILIGKQICQICNNVMQKVRLDKYISDNSDLSREQINKIIEQKNCLVDGRPAIKKSQIIDIDNTIIIDTRDNIEKNNDLILNYEYIDEDIICLLYTSPSPRD